MWCTQKLKAPERTRISRASARAAGSAARGTSAWERVKVTADRCPRITPEFLAEERLALGERWYAQEYLCSFEDAVGAVFSAEDIAAALSDDVSPLFP